MTNVKKKKNEKTMVIKWNIHKGQGSKDEENNET
jgi:hypothetical protein